MPGQNYPYRTLIEFCFEGYPTAPDQKSTGCQWKLRRDHETEKKYLYAVIRQVDAVSSLSDWHGLSGQHHLNLMMFNAKEPSELQCAVVWVEDPSLHAVSFEGPSGQVVPAPAAFRSTGALNARFPVLLLAETALNKLAPLAGMRDAAPGCILRLHRAHCSVAPEPGAAPLILAEIGTLAQYAVFAGSPTADLGDNGRPLCLSSKGHTWTERDERIVRDLQGLARRMSMGTAPRKAARSLWEEWSQAWRDAAGVD
ncbi:unnamed protein product [Pedinophyceae sp. YPF-701]|nr:unnamed protein product [Pedinophyceae sp. YPF-701]